MCIATLWSETPSWHNELQITVRQWSLQIMQLNHSPEVEDASTSHYQDQELPYFLNENPEPSLNDPHQVLCSCSLPTHKRWQPPQ